ncbi:hypothetical protein F511_23754 [Dorcoceras hygrometricum]|uniref:Uncharacterized protein n=1 Tax=Dorcoceras hygrometricum TaxID=472368 RepID=A0A2Z7DJY3_9LAMI|nr:hypothetical protein F511_23754 [Dorcoceras hygrometricum]
MDCGVWVASGVWTNQMVDGRGGGGGVVSYESEHDLAMMVSEFMENGNGGGTDSRYSSDSDSGLPELVQLADKISFLRLVMDQFETDLFSVVNSLARSINERDLYFTHLGLCNASCIRYSLVNLLRLSGYDAGVCTSRWHRNSRVPGGDHEYIDVIRYNDVGGTERVIVDIDFRSHFEIARAVDSYDRILNSLPVIYVGSFTKLKQFLQVMVEAAKVSLKQNSMPLPPWRSYAYLQAKWQSPYVRKFDHDEQNRSTTPAEHNKCAGHLKRLHSSLQPEIEVERMVKPLHGDRRTTFDRRRYPNFQAL